MPKILQLCVECHEPIEQCHRLDGFDGRGACTKPLRAALVDLLGELGEVRFGLQNYLEEHGDAGGIVELLKQVDDALAGHKPSNV